MKARAEVSHQLAWIGGILNEVGSGIIMYLTGDKNTNLGTKYAPSHWELEQKVMEKPRRKNMKERMEDDMKIAHSFPVLKIGKR